jgi:hypothetical protein
MPKALKIAIIVVGLTAGLGLIGWRLLSGGDDTGLANRVAVVDVLSGEAMWVKLDDPRMITVPGKGEAGELSLYPIERVDGRWVIVERYRDGLLEQFEDASRLSIDVSTFESPEAP